MTIIDTDIRSLAQLLLPTFLREKLMTALCEALVEPLEQLRGSLVTLRSATARRLAAGPQVCTLRKILNDVLDPVSRNVEVVDPPSEEEVEPLTLWLRREGKPIWLLLRERNAPVTLNRRGLSGADGYDFWIILPRTPILGFWTVNQAREADIAKEKRARALADTYKLASKRYQIGWKDYRISGEAIDIHQIY